MKNNADIDMLIRDEAQAEAAGDDIRLWRALGRLRSTIAFMNTGAHPDDEQSGLIAWLRFGLGMRVGIACSTRGEGGQNALGPERGDALGLIRTSEMEAAAQVLDAHVAWLGFGTGDPVHDFGFSKDGDDTLRRWQGDLVIRRLAGAYRAFRPDIVLPTFLDVPGQHGHHRAMTRAAEQALQLAADPGAALGDVHGGGLPVWKVAKFYLPGWSGGGGTYDDETPPPPTTLTVRAGSSEPALGVPYDRIGEWSRRRHASQGMGCWPDPPRQEWPLHNTAGRAENSIADGLPADLHQLATLTDLPALSEAAEAIDEAIAAYPRRGAVISALQTAASSLRDAGSAMTPETALRHGHRILNKCREAEIALAEAAGLRFSLSVSPRLCTAENPGRIRLEIETGARARILSASYRTPPGTSVVEGQIVVADDAPPTPNFTAGWNPSGEFAALAVDIRAELDGHILQISVPSQAELRVLPPAIAQISPQSALLTPYDRDARLSIRPGTMALPDIAGISQEATDGRVTLHWQDKAAPIHSRIHFDNADGSPAYTTRTISLPGGGQDTLLERAAVDLLAVDTALPRGRIGVIAGTDRSAEWLTRLGAEIDVIDAPETGKLAGYDTVVLGVMAMSRGDVAPGTLRDYVEDGGNLVSFYQRPDRGWDASESGPRYLRVGTPSLRWRVTDPEAPIDLLSPGHELLNWPNRIGASDWQGWVKDRGLYFAAEWNSVYEPLLSLSDRGEAELHGALLSAGIGKGRHIYCALSLPQQLDALVPGAFRLLVNLVSPFRAAEDTA
ncbi:PIG-L family deacetylase [Paracoccus sediminicola]|uniref:PIG-L family deacetylase n=1 Tax=Paracoccus sediminicola TaxID=3017783 RepID=UPI0022F0E36B|nr:PIG-L family deacetylase [Paracoccus sediminicola]WBU56248.1 PIG-L family deacetylase [Paracoccus sediminicola]